MSRNGSGTYTLPSGNPVVSGTLIEASWANSTLSDIASALTDSLSRSGQGGMTAALRLFDGTSSVPGLAWGSETTTGWYRAGAGDMRLVVTGSEIMRYQSTGVAITGTLSVSGNATVGGTLAITGAVTLTANPTLSAGTANGVAYLNGSKVLTTGSALTFDGTNLGVGTTSPGSFAGKLVVNGGHSILDGNQLFLWSSGNGFAPSIYAPGDSIAFRDNNGSERMRLTSTGLGIGTSSPAQKLHVLADTSGALFQGATLGGVTFLKTGQTGMQLFSDATGTLKVYDNNAGAAVLTVSNQNVGIGTSSPTARLTVSTNTNNEGEIRISDNATYYAGLRRVNATDEFRIGSYGPSQNITFYTVSSERARIDSSGNLLVGTTSGSNRITAVNSGSLAAAIRCENSRNVSGDFALTTQLGSNCNNTSSYHIISATGGADRFYVFGNGNVQNQNNSYGAISDAKLKENVTDATPKLEKLNQVRVVNYNLIGEEQKQLGVIAQELEQIFPGMVEETPDRDAEGNALGTTTKSVKYSVFVPMLIKAIQEQQAIIEQLKADVAALKGN